MAIPRVGHRGPSHDLEVDAEDVEPWPPQAAQGDVQQHLVGDALREEVQPAQPAVGRV